MAEPALPADLAGGLRMPGWPARLSLLVQQRLCMPFAWWHNDCLSFVADAVQALHQRDTLAAARVPRTTARQAVLALRQAGGMPGALCQGFEDAGLPQVQPARAAVGDVVLLAPPRRRWHVLAVCNGDVALSPGAAGLETTPMCHAVWAWRT